MITARRSQGRRGSASVEFIATTAAMVLVSALALRLAAVYCWILFRVCDGVVGSTLM